MGKLFVLGFIIASLLYMILPKNALYVSAQPMGTAVLIDRVSLARDGFVVIENDRKILGATELLPAGIYKNIHVQISLEFMSPGERVYVSLYTDTGDKTHGSEDFRVLKKDLSLR